MIMEPPEMSSDLVHDILNAIDNVSLVCQDPHSIHTGGIFRHRTPLKSSTALLLLQLSLVSLVSQFFNLGLKPIGQSSIVSQIFGGMLFGPSFLGHRKEIADALFPINSAIVLETLAVFGLMFFLFMLGVKIDLNNVLHPERKAVAIGVSCFFTTFACSEAFTFLLVKYLPMDATLVKVLPLIAGSQCITSSAVIACLLTELKMLNTDMGRLALTASAFTDILGICTVAIGMVVLDHNSKNVSVPILAFASAFGLLLVIGFLFRPVILYMLNRSQEGKSLKENYAFVIFVFVLVSGFLSELASQHYFLGPFVLGYVVPDGPPLGSAMVGKVETLASWLFYPTYLAVSGMKTNALKIHFRSLWVVVVLIFFTCLVKMAAVMLPARYFGLPTHEAFVLGIIFNAKGISELIVFNLWKQSMIMTDQEFALGVLSVLGTTAVVTPLVKYLYDPSKQYSVFRRSTIQHLKRESELRIMACIHKPESVPTIINVLEVSHATEENPVAAIALVLADLVGRTTPILVAHTHDNLHSTGTISSKSSQIVNALRQYENYNEGRATLQSFTSVSRYETMHDDICRIACDKKVNIVILPFHKQWAIDGSIGSVSRPIQSLNINVLEKAPCSAGILVDRGILGGSVLVLATRLVFHVAVIFIGGADDAEALAYGARMARHPNVDLTVARFLLFGAENTKDRRRDSDLINEYQRANTVNERFIVVEEVVQDGARLSAVIKSMVDCFDLMLVGRHHQDSPILAGLGEWSECPELGIIGDMLASQDYQSAVSVLVVQQQRIGGKRVNRAKQPIDKELLIHDAAPENTIRASWTITVNERYR